MRIHFKNHPTLNFKTLQSNHKRHSIKKNHIIFFQGRSLLNFPREKASAVPSVRCSIDEC